MKLRISTLVGAGFGALAGISQVAQRPAYFSSAEGMLGGGVRIFADALFLAGVFTLVAMLFGGAKDSK